MILVQQHISEIQSLINQKNYVKAKEVFYNLPIDVYDRLNNKANGKGKLFDENISTHFNKEYKKYRKEMHYNEFSGVNTRYTPKPSEFNG